MELFLKHFVLRCLLVLILPCFLIQCVSSVQQPCLDFERSALLQLKESFSLNKSDADYSKVDSWKLEGEVGGDCCSWHGVECDDNTGHVIGLDLSSSFLYGSIHSNNSLFQLHHLRRLILSDNNFNSSRIPSAIGNLSRLTQLDLSFSAFSGQIPYEVLELSKLVRLDLSGNDLELRNPSLKSLAKRLLNLKHLSLDGVKASSSIPQSLANLSSLTYLSLEDCELRGEFPIEVFQLPNLQYLSACYNKFLTGRLPEFARNSSLGGLGFANTGFSGEIPKSIGNLKSLWGLQLRECNFSGPIPTSLANLTHLTYLALGQNEFSPTTLSWLGKLSKLDTLELDHTNSNGDVLSSLKNLTMLDELLLDRNNFSGRIPSWLGNLTQLVFIELRGNEFWGPLPISIFTLVNLKHLDLEGNHLSGSYKLESFLNLKKLKWLQLSGNNFSLLTTAVTNVTTPAPRLQILALAACNLLEFPVFLSGQDELEFLDLSDNKIHGFIPEWIWGLSAQSLGVLILNGNFLTGYQQPAVVPPRTSLIKLDLSSNMLQGSLPVPTASIHIYYVSNNLLTGQMSPMICDLPSLTVLDISNNSFSGMLPPCSGNLSKSLSVLNIRNNNFRGSVPHTCEKGSQLRMMDLGQNQFNGQMQRSLVNCKVLELLNLGNNQIEDTFPSWLGRLQELKILILRHNKFYGGIGKPESNEFPKLRILDLSFNKFEGRLPSHHFKKWKAMQVVDLGKLNYLKANVSFDVPGLRWSNSFSYSMTMTKAGVVTEYKKIQDFLVAIDLSSNRFEGGIPEDTQILNAVQFLNLSNNLLSGPIPSSLANLTGLQALDLSQNKLSGQIPQELVQLTFLGFFNVSHNQLIGPIPQGKQFGTFDNNSFEGNPGLCGKPLSKECYPSPPSASMTKKDEGGDSWFEFGWKAIMLGYGSGVVNGLVLGYFFNPWKHKLSRRMLLNRRRNRRKQLPFFGTYSLQEEVTPCLLCIGFSILYYVNLSFFYLRHYLTLISSKNNKVLRV